MDQAIIPKWWPPHIIFLPSAPQGSRHVSDSSWLAQCPHAGLPKFTAEVAPDPIATIQARYKRNGAKFHFGTTFVMLSHPEHQIGHFINEAGRLLSTYYHGGRYRAADGAVTGGGDGQSVAVGATSVSGGTGHRPDRVLFALQIEKGLLPMERAHWDAVWAALDAQAGSSDASPAASDAASRGAPETLFRADMAELDMQADCFQRVVYGQSNENQLAEPGDPHKYLLHVWSSPEAATAMRNAAHAAMGWTSPPKPWCATERRGNTLVLARSALDSKQRRVLNHDAMVSMLRDRFSVEPLLKVVDSETPAEEQAKAFRDAAVMITVHGSHEQQWAFMRPNAVMIEIEPALFHFPMRPAANTAGVHFIKTLSESPAKVQQELEAVRAAAATAGKTAEEQQADVDNALWQRTVECMADRECRELARGHDVVVDLAKLETALVEANVYST